MPPSSALLEGTRPLPFVDDLAQFGERTAIVAGGRFVSYRELDRRVQEAAAALGTERRLVRLTGRNDLGTVVAYLAALAAGCTVLMLPDAEGGATIASAYDPDVSAVVDGDVVRWAEHRTVAAHDLHPDLALLLTTSGTTGSPKLVRLSHANLRSNAEAIAAYLDIRDTDRAATTLPLSYCYGLSVLHSHLARGASLLLTDLSVSDRRFWSLFKRSRATSFAGVPYTFELLERMRFDRMRLPHLRYVTQAGGRLAPELVARYAALGRSRGWDLFVMYGQTEATARMAYLPPAMATTRPSAIGVPIPGGSFRLDPVPGAATDEETGELVYSGANVMLGYAESPADLADGRTVDELRTGDVARRTADGLYEIVGRRNRFAPVVGERLDLDRVEAMIAEHGLAAYCATLDDTLVVATVDGRGAHDVLRPVCRRLGLPPHAVVLRLLDRIPRLPSGKPDYQLLARAGSPAPAPRATDAGPAPRVPPQRLTSGRSQADEVRTIFAEALDRPDAALDDTFVSLDGDSLSYVEVSVRLEDVLGELPPEWHTTPIRRLAAPPPARERRVVPTVDTTIALRSLAIVLVVGSHGNLFSFEGGAHLLVAVAGFNFARFHLAGSDVVTRWRRVGASVGRIVAPTVAWVVLASLLLTDDYGPANLVFANAVLGPRELGPTWVFWFVEALVYVVLASAALLSVPAVHRLERRAPVVVALGVVAGGLVLRNGLRESGLGPDLEMPYSVVWLFGLGWAAAVATTALHRFAVTAAAAVAMPGFFYDPSREAVVLAGLLLLIWAPAVPAPPVVRRAVSVLAASSLYVYVTHWQVFPHLQDDVPLLALVASLAVGIAYWQAYERLAARARRMVASVTPATASPAGKVSLS